jgi:hypothetical protein
MGLLSVTVTAQLGGIAPPKGQAFAKRVTPDAFPLMEISAVYQFPAVMLVGREVLVTVARGVGL